MTPARDPWPPPAAAGPLAVLVSGGLDSAILLAEATAVYPAVHPIFVRVGSVWEDAEFAYLQRFLDAVRCSRLKPCVELAQPVDDLYGRHWSITGENVPARFTPDEDSFYVELKPIAPGFDPGAMAVHGIPRERLEREGVPADQAMRDLSRFVGERREGGRAVFVGHNAGFDWSYISYYYENARLKNPFGYKSLDIKSLAMGRLTIGWFETSKETLQRILPGLPEQDHRQVHRADYDAQYQALILCALLNLRS